MNIEEFYQSVGGDYKKVISNLMKDERIMKYLGKFRDADTFPNLEKNLSEKKYKEAFMEAHNLKGMCLNIGLGTLAVSSSDLTEALRNGPTGNVDELFEKTKIDYNNTISIINDFLNNN